MVLPIYDIISQVTVYTGTLVVVAVYINPDGYLGDAELTDMQQVSYCMGFTHATQRLLAQ